MKSTFIGAKAPTSTDMALAMFWAIVAAQGDSTAATLSSALGVPPSTVRRMIGSLVRAKLISRVAHGRYDVSPTLLGRLGAPQVEIQLARIARPLLRRLSRVLNATVHLGVLDRDMVTYLVKESSRGNRLGAIFTAEGGQLEAYCSGIGKVLLAGLPREGREIYLAGGPFIPLTANTLVSPDAIRLHLRTVAEAGYAIDDGEISEAVRCCAVPISSMDGRVVAAISASFTKDHPRWHAIKDSVADVRNTADMIRHRAFGG